MSLDRPSPGDLPHLAQPARIPRNVVVAERYRLVREIGTGGSGVVWMAHHLGLDAPCAVKFLLGHASAVDETVARFRREARTAARLRGSNVAQVLDYGVWQDRPFIAMELLDGESLRDRLKRERPLRPRDVSAIVSDIAVALEAARSAHVVHRDIKPGNLFLVQEGDRVRTKLIDFGIAKTSWGEPEPRSERTMTGALLGTPRFMSPEQLEDARRVDHRSDLWSLAAVAFLCLTGNPPFEGPTLPDLFYQILVEPLPLPSTFAPDLPAAVDAWWTRAAARDPDERFQTAQEMAAALAEAIEAPASTVRDPRCAADALEAFTRREASGFHRVVPAERSAPRVDLTLDMTTVASPGGDSRPASAFPSDSSVTLEDARGAGRRAPSRVRDMSNRLSARSAAAVPLCAGGGRGTR